MKWSLGMTNPGFVRYQWPGKQRIYCGWLVGQGVDYETENLEVVSPVRVGSAKMAEFWMVATKKDDDLNYLICRLYQYLQNLHFKSWYSYTVHCNSINDTSCYTHAYIYQTNNGNTCSNIVKNNRLSGTNLDAALSLTSGLARGLAD